MPSGDSVPQRDVDGPRPAVFLDRDGTLIADRHYLHRPEDVEFLPGAIGALACLQAAGFKLVVVTNQSGVGRGYFSMDDVRAVHARMDAELAASGIAMTGYYVAPEAPDQASRGRKPSAAFLFDARDQHGVDLSRSYMIGDKWIDLECGWNGGVARSLLVRTGYGRETERECAGRLGGAVVVDGLEQAAGWILERMAAGGAGPSSEC